MEPIAPEEVAGPFGRRRFMRALLGFSIVSTIAMIVTPIIGFLVPPASAGGGADGRVSAGSTADLPPRTGAIVAMGSKPVIVINTDAGVKAYSAVCTHLGCIVGYDATTNLIICPCHDGHFSPASGDVVSGPPPKPLAPVSVVVENDQIFLVAG